MFGVALLLPPWWARTYAVCVVAAHALGNALPRRHARRSTCHVHDAHAALHRLSLQHVPWKQAFPDLLACSVPMSLSSTSQPRFKPETALASRYESA